MRHSTSGWQSDLEVSLSDTLVTETVYVRMELIDRVQRFYVYSGPSETRSRLVASKYLVHTGSYDAPSSNHLYSAAPVATEAAAKGFYDPRTLTLSHTLLGSATAMFYVSPYTSLPLSNMIRDNFTAASLMQDATTLSTYNSMFTSSATLGSTGPMAGDASVCTDGESALIHNTIDSKFVMDGVSNTATTACLWANRTGSFDTLFPTLLDGVGSIRFYAFFNDVSYHPHGLFSTNIRASPPHKANLLPTTGWTHICASASVGQPAKLYINGTLASHESEPSVVAGQPAQRPIALGGSSDLQLHTGYSVDRGIKACMNHLVLWARELSDAEVFAVYSSRLSSMFSL